METGTEKTTRRRRTAIAAAVLIPVVLLSGLHFFVSYKAKQLLPTLVSRLSDGQYTISSEKFSFNYFNPYLRLTKVHFKPAQSNLDEEYHVRIDSFYLSIESILPIFFNDAINVKAIRLVNPSVTVKRNTRKDENPDSDEIHQRVNAMQNNAIRFFNELSVNECDIVNGSFRFYPFPGSERNFNIEHVTLSIRDLVIPPYVGDQTKGIDGKIKLTITEPRLSIPDSLLDISMDQFTWDNQERYINVGKFVISQRSSPPRADSFLIALDTIRIRQVYWSAWLDSGLLKLDTLIANNGDMYFESSGKKPKRKQGDSAKNMRQLKVWDAIGNLDIDHFSARYINAAIINRNPGSERSNSVIGDSLIISGISVRPQAVEPLMIRDLGLGVREFLDRGANIKFQSSFSRMKLRGDTMILDNYFIQSTPRSRLGKGSSLLIPTLTIEGLSIDDLMDEKANIRVVRMDKPKLTLFTDLKGENTGGIAISRKTMEEIRPWVDVERVILNDAQFTINSKTEKGTSLGTQEFSAVILSRAAMGASDMDGLLSSFKDVNLKKFFFITPRMQMELLDGDVDYQGRALGFAKATGYINNKRIFADLRNVRLLGDSGLHPFERDVVWHFRKLSVDSGALSFALDSSATPDGGDPDEMIGLIDSLELKNLSIQVRKKELNASAFVERADVQGHNIYNGHYRWDKAMLQLRNIAVKTNTLSVSGNSAKLVSDGKSSFSATEVSLNNGSVDLKVKAPEVSIVSNIHEINVNDITLQNLVLVDPVISLDLKKSEGVPQVAVLGNRRYELKRFELFRPQLSVFINGNEHLTRLFSNGGSFDGSSMLYEQKDSMRTFTIGQLVSQMNSLKMDDGDNEVFKTGSLTLELANFIKQYGFPAALDLQKFSVGAVDVNNIRHRDTMEIRTGGITLGNIPGLVLRKDSLLQAAFKIPPATVLPSSFTMRTPQTKFSIQNFRVNTSRQYLEWDSLEVQNRISRDSFFAAQPFEKDYFTVSTGRIRADALRPVLYNKDTAIYIRKLTVDPLHFKVERDKRMPDDTISYRPLMTRMLNRLPFLIKVDSVQLANSLVWHNVIDEKTEKEGTIFFTSVNGYLTNVKNYDLGSADSLRIHLNSRLMGKGELRMQFREAYDDTLQGFLLAAKMGAMEMTELNRLMKPLFNVRVDRGKIRDLTLKVKGTETLAYGTMEMNYDRLRVSILTQENKRRDLVSWFANLFMRGKNNKIGIVYAERLKDKSIFNYWARISVNGLLTNLGVKQNGKQVRRFYKGLQKNQLPPDLF